MTDHLSPYTERLAWIDKLPEPPIRIGHLIRLLWQLYQWEDNPDAFTYEDGSVAHFGQPDQGVTWRFIRETGLRLHLTGGMAAMWIAYYALEADAGSCLDLAWDEIGDWRA
jgi:hypothetical protein